MSEAFITSIFLALSGGFQDAYTYFTRDGVFSNAQTGNVVLMSQHFMMKEWSKGFHYLLPLFAFAAGVFAAEQIQSKFRYAKKLHWRQGILLFEILILFLVGFIPSSLNVAATTLVSFGNLRSGTAALSVYFREHKKDQLRQSLYYFGIILFFAIGAGIGGNLSAHYGLHTIWISDGLLCVSFVLMFIERLG